MQGQRPMNEGGRVLAFPTAPGAEDAAALQRQFLDHGLMKINLCCALEMLADGLRSDADLGRAEMLLRGAGTLLTRAHRFEEDEAFPLLRRTRPKDEALLHSLARLEQEHIEDAAFAGELLDACSTLIAGWPVPDDNTFGYMLRGFFGSVRRHVAFEREHIVPLLAKMH